MSQLEKIRSDAVREYKNALQRDTTTTTIRKKSFARTMFAYLILCVCMTQLIALTPREIVMNKLIQDISDEQVGDPK